MARLTKTIANKLKEENPIDKFVFFGEKDGYEYYQGLRTHGGKSGFPLVFGIGEKNDIIWVEDFGTLYTVRHINPTFDIIEPE